MVLAIRNLEKGMGDESKKILKLKILGKLNLEEVYMQIKIY